MTLMWFANLERVVQASLVAADAGVDAGHVSPGGLVHDFRVRQERSRHGDQVGIAIG